MAGDPFLSDPSKKRKRKTKVSKATPKQAQNKTNSALEDDVISGGSDSDDEQGNVSLDSDEVDNSEEVELSSDEEFAQESAADKRRRLAKQYLENLQSSEFGAGEYDFDAQDLDDDILARRLQKDVAEQKGFVYKFIGEAVKRSVDQAKVQMTRIGSQNVTDMSIREPYLYTVSKDIELIKWKLNEEGVPQRMKHVKGINRGSKSHTSGSNHKGANNTVVHHHTGPILCVATSPDGKYVVTGGQDGRLIIWSSENLACLKVLEVCRKGAINQICFRRGTDTLYAACEDLKIRTFSINQFAQLEVLYGHQDNIVDISCLSKETCVSVGARDKTAMFWKVAEESRLTFRAGSHKDLHTEGSIDCVSMVDESHFVTGSDNGTVALWSLAKKKALSSKQIAHGLRPELATTRASAERATNEINVPPAQPYEISSIHAVPYSDIFITGSYNGAIKIWKISSEGLRWFEELAQVDGFKGCVVSIADAVLNKNKLSIYVLTSKENKFGRWYKVNKGKNALVRFTVDIE